MRLIIISGRSGSGKSAALNVLEDMGFYCIDNLPAGLLPSLTEHVSPGDETLHRLAVSIDARNVPHAIASFPDVLKTVSGSEYKAEVIYLDASHETLIQRFSSTRRKHPLTGENLSLAEAIENEHALLRPVRDQADLTVDTTRMSVHDLRTLIRQRIIDRQTDNMAVLFQSFGFKHGIPIDADLVFDVRNLPNPYWHPELRAFTGRDQPIIDFLSQEEPVLEMKNDIRNYLEKWLPDFESANRSYMTIAIGCTGGQHRSVFMSEQLASEFAGRFGNVQVRHRELPE